MELMVFVKRTGAGCNIMVIKLDDALLYEELNDPNLVVICDTCLPPGLYCVFALISSPAQLRESKFVDLLQKFGKGHIHVPLTCLEEISEMNQSVFEGLALSDKELEARVELWGPVPGLVFVESDASFQEEDLQSIKTMPPDDIQTAYDQLRKNAADGNNPHHKLFLQRAFGQIEDSKTDVRSAEYYKRGDIVIASPVFADWLMRAIKREKKLQAADFTFWSAGVGEHGARCRTIFEELSLRVLEKGGRFEFCRLNDRTMHNWTIHGLKRVDWDERWGKDTLEAVAVNNTLLVPRIKNESELDAFMWVKQFQHHVPVDFSVSARPEIQLRGLAQKVTKLGDRGWTAGTGWVNAPEKDKQRQVEYLWAVPDDKFEAWSREKLPAQTRSSISIGRHLAQYALKMPLDVLFSVLDVKAANSFIDAAIEKLKTTLRTTRKRGRRS